MAIKLEESDVSKLKELLMAKSECYAQVKEIYHYCEQFAIGIWQEQKKLEEKYKIDLATGKFKLNLENNTVEEISQVIT